MITRSHRRSAFLYHCGETVQRGHFGERRAAISPALSLASLALYPEVNGLKLLTFPACDPRSEDESTLDAGSGCFGPSVLRIPESQAAVGQRQAVIACKRFCECRIGAMILGKEPVATFLPALRGCRIAGVNGHSLTVLKNMWHICPP